MRGSVQDRLSKWYSDTLLLHNATPQWVLFKPEKTQRFPDAVNKYLEHGLQDLASLSGQSPSTFTTCSKALLHRGFGSANKGTRERLLIGGIIQVLLKGDYQHKNFINSYMSERGAPIFFVIGGFYRGPDHKAWAIVKPCQLIDTETVPQLPDLSNSGLLQVSTSDFYSVLDYSHQFIEMTSVVRKVGFIHNCSNSNLCEYNTATRRVTHCTTTTAGGSFLLVTRWMGYPPRKS